MSRIFSYEMKSLLLGKSKFKLFAGCLLLALAYLGISLTDDVPDGITALGEGLSFYSSIIVFLAPVLAGVFLSQSFEDRMIQNCLMSGQKRFNIVAGKSMYFFVLNLLFLLIPTIISTATITVLKGWNQTGQNFNLGMLLVQAGLFILLVVTAYMIVVPVAFHFKKTGPTIGIGLLVSVLVYSFTQEFMQRESLHKILKWSPLGNSYFVFNENGLGLLQTAAVIMIWGLLFVLITMLRFNKEELK